MFNIQVESLSTGFVVKFVSQAYSSSLYCADIATVTSTISSMIASYTAANTPKA